MAPRGPHGLGCGLPNDRRGRRGSVAATTPDHLTQMDTPLATLRSSRSGALGPAAHDRIRPIASAPVGTGAACENDGLHWPRRDGSQACNRLGADARSACAAFVRHRSPSRVISAAPRGAWHDRFRRNPIARAALGWRSHWRQSDRLDQAAGRQQRACAFAQSQASGCRDPHNRSFILQWPRLARSRWRPRDRIAAGAASARLSSSSHCGRPSRSRGDCCLGRLCAPSRDRVVVAWPLVLATVIAAAPDPVPPHLQLIPARRLS